MNTSRLIAPTVFFLAMLAGTAAACPLCQPAADASTDGSGVQRVGLGRGVAGAALAASATSGRPERRGEQDCRVGCSAGRAMPPEVLRSVIGKIGYQAPGPVGGERCYSDRLTVAQFEYIMANYNALPPGVFLPGNAVPQYTTTPTVWTGAGGQGLAATATRASLTFSFPDDGVPWDSSGVSLNQLAADLRSIVGPANLDQGRELIRQALTSWRRNAGLSYTEVADSNIPLDFVVGRRAGVGDVRIGSIPQGLSGVLAYNFFPTGGGDTTFNTDYFAADQGSFSDGSNNFRYLRNVMAHEHGHGIGLSHQTPCNNTKLMEPFASSAFDMVVLDDRRGGQRSYGDRFSGNTSLAFARNFGNLTSPTVRSVIERDLSTNGQYTIANLAGADWFRFSLSTAQNLTISVAPTGVAYLTGSQTNGCNPTMVPTVTAQNAGNLAVTLYDDPALNILFLADASINGTETITTGLLPAGSYAVRVFDVGPNASVNQFVQNYDLTIRVGTSKASPAAYAGVNKRVAANTRACFYGNLNSYANEGTVSSYGWDFNGDGAYEVTGGNVFRTYVTNGTFAATLRVTDSNGMSATDTINVTVFGATSGVSSVTPGSALAGATVPITIVGTNFRGITTGGVSVSGGGVSIVGTPTVDYLGTTITGLSMVISPGAAGGPRTIEVLTTDGPASLPGAVNIITCPVITAGPASTVAAQGGTLSLSSTVGGTAARTYQWLRNSTPVSTPAASGATTPALTISPVSLADAGSYTLRVTSACGVITSPAAVVTVTGANCGLADLVNGGGLTPGDGIVDGSDFIAFINAFSNGDALADVVADGVVDGSDFVAFINAFAQGC